MLTFRKQMDSFLSWGWDPRQHDANVMRRVRTLALVGMIGIGLLIPFIVRSFYWQIPVRMITQPFCLVLLVVALRVLNARQDMAGIGQSARLMCASLALAGLGGLLTTGGIGAAAQGWLMLVPLMAAVTVSLPSALRWAAVCYGGIAVIGVYQVGGGHLPNLTPPSFQRYESLFQSTAVFMSLAMLLSAYGSQLRYAEQANRDKNRQLLEEMAERQKAEHDALLAEQSKNRFLAGMGMEMRTPLNVLQGTLPRLEKKLLDRLNDRERMAFVHIGENVASLAALVEDVFECAAIESGTLRLNHETVDLVQLLASVQRRLETEAPLSGLALTVHAGLPFMVRADARRLQHAISNIVRYSLQYIEAGEVTLTLQGQEPGLIRIEVSDTGVPFTEAQRHSLFDRDNAAPRAPLRVTGVTSLGMSVARALIALHGGQIDVHSTAAGNQFVITLPVNAVG